MKTLVRMAPLVLLLFFSFIFVSAARAVTGYVSAPDKPGLGFEIDWGVVEKYAVKESPTGSLYY